MSTVDAAEYLSIGRTSVREKGPKPIFFGKRRLYDIKDLDRWADQLRHGCSPPTDEAAAKAKIQAWLAANESGSAAEQTSAGVESAFL